MDSSARRETHKIHTGIDLEQFQVWGMIALRESQPAFSVQHVPGGVTAGLARYDGAQRR